MVSHLMTMVKYEVLPINEMGNFLSEYSPVTIPPPLFEIFQ